jgi:ubiquinone/menaquinone biosynthesis C-methylase UbiE
MSSRYSEAETEQFYDEEDAIYRSFWDAEGSLHWGYFDGTADDDFLGASARLDEVMAAKGRIDASSHVLDLGCGNGVTARWLAERYGCRVTGIDLSGVRIDNAKEMMTREPEELQRLVRFEHGSATDLPFADGEFTHVWSQATIYHVPDKETALRESRRVLAKGGLLVLDDLLKPKTEVSEQSRQYVYDRLLFDTPFSFTGYQDYLKSIGFAILEAEDLSAYLRRSYVMLGEKAAWHAHGELEERLTGLNFAYGKMVEAIDREELGWGLYIAQAS